jgi:hypothetical protein
MSVVDPARPVYNSDINTVGVPGMGILVPLQLIAI